MDYLYQREEITIPEGVKEINENSLTDYNFSKITIPS